MTEQQIKDAETLALALPKQAMRTVMSVIAEVRRLQQQEQQWQGWQESKMILLNSEMALCAERDAALAERDRQRNKLTAMTAARNIEEDRANQADGQLMVLDAEMVALHTQLGADDEESLLDAGARLQSALTEARRVLRAVRADLDLLVPVAQTSELPVTANAMIRISADISAVLAQDTDA